MSGALAENRLRQPKPAATLRVVPPALDSVPSTAALPPFQLVVDRHGPALLRFCAAKAGPEHAEDCFQETMLAALRAYTTVNDPAAVRSWLFTIAARKAADIHRARARQPIPVEAVDELAGGYEPELRDDSLWVHVRALPAKQREAVTLRYLADLTYPEVAEVMGISQAAARRNVFEGLRRLRADLDSSSHNPTAGTV